MKDVTGLNLPSSARDFYALCRFLDNKKEYEAKMDALVGTVEKINKVYKALEIGNNIVQKQGEAARILIEANKKLEAAKQTQNTFNAEFREKTEVLDARIEATTQAEKELASRSKSLEADMNGLSLALKKAKDDATAAATVAKVAKDEAEAIKTQYAEKLEKLKSLAAA